MRSLIVICLTAVSAASFAGGPGEAAQSSAFVQEARLAEFTQRYQVQGSEIEAGFVPYSTDVVVGEPVVVTFFVKNTGSGDIEIRTFSPRGQPDPTFNITAEDESGRPVRPAECRNLGGLGSSTRLHPGQTFYHALFLQDHLALLEPGRYTVTCARCTEHDYGTYRLPEIQTRFGLTVRPADPKALGKTIERLGKIVREAPVHLITITASDQDPVTATKALAAIQDERTVPDLLEALKRGGAGSEMGTIGYIQIPAIEGLAKYPSARLVTAFQSSLQDSGDSSVRSAAVRALGSFKYPEAVKLLIGALDDTDKQVRRDALDSLGKIGDRSVVNSLRRFLKAEDSDLIMAAIQALEQLGESPELSWYDPIFVARSTNAFQAAIWDIRRRWGEKGLPYLASKLDLDHPGKKSYYNYTLTWQIAAISGENFAYRHDFDDDGTEADRDCNTQVMRAIQAKWPL